ncbi:hypothetical protein LJC48_00680 [Desulfovibrio sp. OttesenSCG-928-C06]|nr:hypothetical protein [Desulfovibrio sp. OttesenSCG-928-C06]
MTDDKNNMPSPMDADDSTMDSGGSGSGEYTENVSQTAAAAGELPEEPVAVTVTENAGADEASDTESGAETDSSIAGNMSMSGEDGFYTRYRKQAIDTDDNFSAPDAEGARTGNMGDSTVDFEDSGKVAAGQSDQLSADAVTVEDSSAFSDDFGPTAADNYAEAASGSGLASSSSSSSSAAADDDDDNDAAVAAAGGPADAARAAGDATSDNAGDLESAVFAASAEAEQATETQSKKAARKPKEVLPQFPSLKTPPQASATMLSRLFDACAFIGPVVLTVLLLAQVFFSLQDARLLWISETVQAEALRNVLNGEWMVPMVNGGVFVAYPPLYLWLLSGIHEVLSWPAISGLLAPGTDLIALSMFAGTAVSALLLLWSVLGLARFVARLDLRGVFAAGCVLFGFFIFAGGLHHGGNQLFFAALVITAQIFIYRAMRYSGSAMPIMGTGFVFAAMAFLAGGPLGLLLPVLTAVLFAFWSGRPQRLLRKDFLLGFAFSLLPVVVWAGSIWAEGHYEVVVTLVREQIWGTLLHSLNYPESWWYYLVVLPLLLFPWILLVIFPHWAGFFSKETGEAIKGAFRGDHQGLAYVWLVFICALAGFLLLSSKSPLELMPLLAPVSIIAGRILLKLSPVRNMLLQRCYAVLLLVLAFGCAVIPVYMSGKAPSVLAWLGSLGVPQLGIDIGGVFIAAAIFLAAGCLFLGAVSSRRPEGTLVILLLMIVGLSYPAGVLTAPSLGPVLSPKRLSSDIAAHAAQGFKPYALGMSGDALAYYSGVEVTALPGPDSLASLLSAGGKIVLVSPVSAGRAQDVPRTAPVLSALSENQDDTAQPEGSSDAGSSAASDAVATSTNASAVASNSTASGAAADAASGGGGDVSGGTAGEEPATAANGTAGAQAAAGEQPATEAAVSAVSIPNHLIPDSWLKVGGYRLGSTEYVLLASEKLEAVATPDTDERSGAGASNGKGDKGGDSSEDGGPSDATSDSAQAANAPAG